MGSQGKIVWEEIEESKLYGKKARYSREILDVAALARLHRRGLGPAGKGYDARPKDAR